MIQAIVPELIHNPQHLPALLVEHEHNASLLAGAQCVSICIWFKLVYRDVKAFLKSLYFQEIGPTRARVCAALRQYGRPTNC